MRENVTRSKAGEYLYEWDEEVTIPIGPCGEGEATGFAGICLAEEDLREMLREIEIRKAQDTPQRAKRTAVEMDPLSKQYSTVGGEK